MIVCDTEVRILELNYHVTFECEEKCWEFNENAGSLIQATSIAENITQLLYSNSTFITINLPDGIWHVFCNKPILLEKIDDKVIVKIK